MAVPDIVRNRLDDEEIRARVPLGGDDELVVTPTRSLLYRADGLLSGESVEEHRHEAERLLVKTGRRKSTIRLERGLSGDSEFTVPSDTLESVLPPLLEGVLSAADVTDDDEVVEEVYRLGELTVVIAENRVIKHVGDAVWDEEYEEFPFADVTGVDVEAGEVSSQVIVEVDGRPERIKTPSDDARVIRERIESVLLSYYDVQHYAEFRDIVAPDDEEETDAAGGDAASGDESSVTGDGDDPEPDDTELVFGGEAAETLAVETGNAAPADIDDELAEALAALRAVIERQNELLEDHHRTIEQLIQELRRGR